jgi:hypothetical protein
MAVKTDTVMWNDIDLYHAFRDFTTDPVSFPVNEVKTFIDELVRMQCIILLRRFVEALLCQDRQPPTL